MVLIKIFDIYTFQHFENVFKNFLYFFNDTQEYKLQGHFGCFRRQSRRHYLWSTERHGHNENIAAIITGTYTLIASLVLIGLSLI